MERKNEKRIVRADDVESVMADSLTEETAVSEPEARKDYDIPEKELEDYPDVFADIINALIYQGSKVLFLFYLEDRASVGGTGTAECIIGE